LGLILHVKIALVILKTSVILTVDKQHGFFPTAVTHSMKTKITAG